MAFLNTAVVLENCNRWRISLM